MGRILVVNIRKVRVTPIVRVVTLERTRFPVSRSSSHFPVSRTASRHGMSSQSLQLGFFQLVLICFVFESTSQTLDALLECGKHVVLKGENVLQSLLLDNQFLDRDRAKWNHLSIRS